VETHELGQLIMEVVDGFRRSSANARAFKVHKTYYALMYKSRYIARIGGIKVKTAFRIFKERALKNRWLNRLKHAGLLKAT